jgi:hypothetical protein
VTSESIISDRMPRHDRHGNTQAAGEVMVELLAGDYDAFLESLMFSTWDASPSSAPDELKVGTTLKSFTIEDYLADIDQARCLLVWQSLRLPSLWHLTRWSTRPLSLLVLVVPSLQLKKRLMLPLPTNPLTPTAGSLDIGDAGGSLSGVTSITSIELTVNNSLNPTFVIGSATTPST